MDQFLIKLKWWLPALVLLLSAGASAQSPETYTGYWTNTGYVSHSAGTGVNAFSIATVGTYEASASGSGTDEFIGPNGVAGDQEIAGSSFPNFGTLVVNNGAGKLLTITNTGRISIYTGITFTSGVISNRALGSSAQSLFFKASAASPSTASNSSFVDGYVTSVGSTAFTFPVGDLSAAAGMQYHPLTLGTLSGSTTATVSYAASAPPSSSNLSPSVMSLDPASYWTLSATGSVTGVVTVTTPDETAVYGPSAPVFLAGYNTSTSQWENVNGGSTPASGPNQALSSSTITLSQYSAFAVGSTITPLPITLVSFSGTSDGCDANLTWQTALEQNSDRYEIQLSADGDGFTTVGSVKSRNSATGATYTYQYGNLRNGQNYFRLRAVDYDGKATYSPIVSVISNCKVGGMIVVSPNPAKDVVNIRGLDDGRNQIILFDINGKKLVELIASGTSQSLPVSRYPKGIYILRVINAGGAIVNMKVQKE